MVHVSIVPGNPALVVDFSQLFLVLFYVPFFNGTFCMYIVSTCRVARL